MATSTTSFPSHDVDPAKKVQKDWCKQFARAIDGLYNTGQCAWGRNDVINMARLRAYGNGAQDQNQYKDLLGMNKKATPTIPTQATSQNVPDGPNAGARKGWMNINWDILAIAPKFKSIVLGTFEDMEHDIFADGVDEKSSAEREQMKWSLWVEKEFGDYFRAQEAAIGLQSEKPDYVPATMQELQMFSDLGGFKLRSEISIEEGLRYTFAISEQKELKRKIIEDLFDIGVAVEKDYVDPFTQKVKVRYVDPAMSVLPYMRSTDYSNMPFAGEYIWYSIAEIRSLNNVDGTPVFTNQELEDIARGLQDNPPPNSPYSYACDNWEQNQWGRYMYDDFMVLVLDCEFRSDDYKYITERTKPDGRKIVQQDEFGRVRDSDKKKTHKTKTLMVYKCKWIVGTDFCFDYGHQFDIPRPTPSQANLSFHAYRVKGRSMVDMMTPVLDSLQLTWLKLQNAKAMAKPKGISVEYNSLINMSIGNQKTSPLEIIKIYGQSGVLLHATTTHNGYAPGAMNQKPIQELEGGLGAQGLEFLQQMNNDLNLLRDITGINRVADASSPSGEDLVGVSEMAMQATSTALKPMYAGYITIKERVAKNVALRIQLLVKFNGTYELGYYHAIGKPMTQTLKIGAEVNNAMFGIRIQARASGQERQRIYDAAMQSLAVGKSGQVGINMSDYLVITRFIESGMLKLAEAYLAQKERQEKERQEALAQKNIELQGQQQQQLEQMKAAQGQEMAKASMDLLISTEDQKRITLELQHTHKMAEIRLTKGMEQQTKVLEKTIDSANLDKQLETQKEIAEEQAEKPESKTEEK